MLGTTVEIQLDRLGEDGLRSIGEVEHALFLGVGLDQGHVVIIAAGEP